MNRLTCKMQCTIMVFMYMHVWACFLDEAGGMGAMVRGSSSEVSVKG